MALPDDFETPVAISLRRRRLASSEHRLRIDEFTILLHLTPSTEKVKRETLDENKDADAAFLRTYTQSFLEQGYSRRLSLERVNVFLFSPEQSRDEMDEDEAFTRFKDFDISSTMETSPVLVSFFGYASFPFVAANSQIPSKEQLRNTTQALFEESNAYASGLATHSPDGSAWKYVRGASATVRSMNEKGHANEVGAIYQAPSLPPPISDPISFSYERSLANVTSIGPSAINFTSMSPSAAPTMQGNIRPESQVSALSPGVITGIVIGCVLGALGIFGGFFLLFRRRNRKDTGRKPKTADAPLNKEKGNEKGEDRIHEAETGSFIPLTTSLNAEVAPVESQNVSSPAKKVGSRRHLSPKALSTKLKTSMKVLEKGSEQSPPSSPTKRSRKGASQGEKVKQQTTPSKDNVSSIGSFALDNAPSMGSSIAPPSVSSNDDALNQLEDPEDTDDAQPSTVHGSDIISEADFTGLDDEKFNDVLQFDTAKKPIFQFSDDLSQDEDNKVLAWDNDPSETFSLGYSFGKEDEEEDSRVGHKTTRQSTEEARISGLDSAVSVEIDDTLSAGSESRTSVQKLEDKYEKLVNSVQDLNIDDLLPSQETEATDKDETFFDDPDAKPSQKLDADKEDIPSVQSEDNVIAAEVQGSLSDDAGQISGAEKDINGKESIEGLGTQKEGDEKSAEVSLH